MAEIALLLPCAWLQAPPLAYRTASACPQCLSSHSCPPRSVLHRAAGEICERLRRGMALILLPLVLAKETPCDQVPTAFLVSFPTSPCSLPCSQVCQPQAHSRAFAPAAPSAGMRPLMSSQPYLLRETFSDPSLANLTPSFPIPLRFYVLSGCLSKTCCLQGLVYLLSVCP